MRKHRRWLFPLIALGAISIVVAWQKQPSIRIGASSVPLSYIPAGAVNAKPKVSFSLPGVGKVQFPRPVKMLLSPSRDQGWAGFIEHPVNKGFQGWPQWKVGDLQFRATSRALGSKPDPSRPGIRIVTRAAFGAPYALRPEYRPAMLQYKQDGEWVEVELPLAPAHAEPKIEDSSVSAGDWIVHARPKPWKTTASPVEFEIEIEGREGVELLVDYDWIHHDTWGYNPLKKVGIWAWSNKSFPLTVSARIAPPLEGVIHEVKAVPVEFKVSRRPGFPQQMDIFFQGKCVQAGWLQNSHHPNSFGFKAFRVGDRFFGNATPNFVTKPAEPENWSGRLDGQKLKDGQVIQGYGYRVLKSYPFKLQLNRPVTKEMLSFGTQPKF